MTKETRLQVSLAIGLVAGWSIFVWIAEATRWFKPPSECNCAKEQCVELRIEKVYQNDLDRPFILLCDDKPCRYQLQDFEDHVNGDKE